MVNVHKVFDGTINERVEHNIKLSVRRDSSSGQKKIMLEFSSERDKNGVTRSVSEEIASINSLVVINDRLEGKTINGTCFSLERGVWGDWSWSVIRQLAADLDIPGALHGDSV